MQMDKAIFAIKTKHQEKAIRFAKIRKEKLRTQGAITMT